MDRLRTFVVEQYVSQLNRAAAMAIARRFDDASAQMREDGVPVHWIRAVALPGEESLLCFIEAESVDQVLRASERAGVTPGHVHEAIALESTRLKRPGSGAGAA